MNRSNRRRRKHRPAGVEFDGKCRQVEQAARQCNVPLSEVRLSDFLFFNGQQWTVRSVFERRLGESWVELDWNPPTHSIAVDRDGDDRPD